MSYELINWENSPSMKTPINAENLNKMDQGIYDAHEELGKLPEWSKKETKPDYTAEEVGALPDNTDIPSKTSDLENDSGFITKEVSDLANYHTKQETKEMLYNKANSIVEKKSGETIATTDSAPVPPLNLKTYGKSTQKQYEGYQLLDVSKATTYSNHLQVDSDGWMTVTLDNSSGTSILYIGVAIPVSDLLETGKQYLSVCEVKSNTLGYAEIISPNTTNNKSQFSAGQALSAGYTGTSVKVVTTRDDFSDCKTMTRTTLRADAGVSGSITFRLSIIEDTTVTADTFVYEPFVGGEASPSLNYQQEVTPLGASGSIVEKVLNANMLKISNKTVSYNGGTLTVTNGVGVLSGTPTTSCTLWYMGSYKNKSIVFTLLPGEYSISNCTLWYWDNGTFTFLSKAFVIDEPLDIYGVSTDTYPANTVLSGTFYPMLCYGEIKDWQPYAEQSLTYQTPNGLHGIPLGTTIPDAIKNSAIHMSGVYWDSVEQQYYIGNTKNENGKDVQRILETVFDGSNDEVWFVGSNNRYATAILQTLILPPETNSKLAYAFSTHGIVITGNECYSNTKKGIAFSTDGNMYFYTGESETDLDAWKAKLTESPMTVYTVLKDPIITDTSEEELAQFNALVMNYPNTTIVNDAGAYTELEYVCDTQMHIEQNYAPKSEIQEMKDQIAELQALMVNNS